MEPVMTLRWIVDGEVQPDVVEVLWTGANGDAGSYVSLISHPELNYVIVTHDHLFAHGQEFTDDDLNWPYISLGRPAAGGLALALITALINGSDQIIDHYIHEMMARR